MLNCTVTLDCVTKGPDVYTMLQRWCRFIYSAHLIRLLVQFSAVLLPAQLSPPVPANSQNIGRARLANQPQLSWQPPWHCPLNSLHQPPLQWSHRPALSYSFYSLIKFLFTVKATVVVGQTCCCGQLGTTVTPISYHHTHNSTHTVVNSFYLHARYSAHCHSAHPLSSRGPSVLLNQEGKIKQLLPAVPACLPEHCP